ncbi:juvenile hormone acid O-methyltransferase-like [Bombyx mandarina]|uniref:Juvenile hormone acid O-methyltransferase-like n=1 Tax=Bombyx mandarina TaxID=7092 RepID=A0A6J2KQX7_BOMMA|nr:juvenile hormone acid O-methyltransferase-like [Bombyx mandarina]
MSEHCETDSNARSFTMNDDAELYRNSSSMQRRDALNSLTEYLPKFKWKESKEKILDIGCADGSVTNIISSCCPTDFELFEACDVNVKSVKYATEHYGTSKMRFRVMDIEGDLPKEMERKFDHVFSFYTLHWIENQEKAFQNIYDLTADDGECFLTLLAQMPVFNLFDALKHTDKWRHWLRYIKNFISPYYETSDPDVVIELLLKRVGFRYVDVRCRQKKFEFYDIKSFRNLLEAVSPFKVGQELQEELIDDVMEVAKEMRIIDTQNSTAKLIYNLVVIHCRK